MFKGNIIKKKLFFKYHFQIRAFHDPIYENEANSTKKKCMPPKSVSICILFVNISYNIGIK